jgi:hypothetical protein
MKSLCQNVMNVFFIDLVKNFASNFQIWTGTAIPETMVPLEKNLIRKTMLVDIALNNLQEGFIPPCKTGTSKTNYNLAPMIHYAFRIVV